MTETPHTLTIEYDKDNNRVYAYLSNDYEIICDFDNSIEVDNLLNYSELLYINRWDGATSTPLCPEYNGKPCTTGGRKEVYSVDLSEGFHV